MPVRTLLSMLTPGELKGWIDYMRDEPLMADRIEAQLATLIALTSSAHGVQKRPEDFMISRHMRPSLADKVAKMFGG